MKSALILPTVHVNGTSPIILIARYTEARLAVETALSALVETYAIRVFYPQGDAVRRNATQQHLARTGALRGIINDLHALETHVALTETFRNGS